MAAVAAGSAFAGTAKSTKIVTFNGTYAGAANVTVSDTVATLAAAGPGKASRPASPPSPSSASASSRGPARAAPTSPPVARRSTARASLTGVAGAKLNFKITGAQACGDSETGPWSISGRATVTGGAGVYKKAKGSLKVTGVYNGSDKKTFSVKFVGKLTV